MALTAGHLFHFCAVIASCIPLGSCYYWGPISLLPCNCCQAISLGFCYYWGPISLLPCNCCHTISLESCYYWGPIWNCALAINGRAEKCYDLYIMDLCQMTQISGEQCFINENCSEPGCPGELVAKLS